MQPLLARLCVAIVLLAGLLPTWAQDASQEAAVKGFFGNPVSSHTNNWAVLVCASRYWFNYRHMSNAIGMYRTVKRLGIPDSNIILMLADDAACNSRNKFAGCVFANAGRTLDLYGDNIEVDYRGYEVTVENFLRVLTGRMDPSVPRSKRLLTDDKSNIFVYMTGHGGNEFLKFQDNEEISAYDIADAFEQMWQKKRYNEIFFMIDTCQANTMYSKFYSPNILATGSSLLAENSYSYENDNDIGVAVIDSYTHHILEFMEGIDKTSQKSMQDLFDTYSFEKIHSHPGVRSDLFPRSLRQALVTDFFGGVSQAEVISSVPERNATRQESKKPQADWPAIVNANIGPADLSSVYHPNNTAHGSHVALNMSLFVDDTTKLHRTTGSTLRAWASTALVGGVVALALRTRTK